MFGKLNNVYYELNNNNIDGNICFEDQLPSARVAL